MRERPSFAEFVALMATTVSLVALSIDAMLPALPAIGEDLGVVGANHTQLVVGVLFVGMALGQMIYGPLSDSTGRRPAILIGFAIFLAGSLLALLAQSFPLMLAGRFLQGMGAAGPRIVSIALIRDCFAGREMARVMSFIMAVFILVPALAPALGQLILALAHWRAIFAALLLMGLVAATWFALRQPETLAAKNRRSFSVGVIAAGVAEVCGNRIAIGYTVATGLVFSAFLGYLSTVQPMLQVQYALGARFPLYFAVLALSIGAASFLNGRLVIRHGMHKLARLALWGLTALSLGFLVVAWWFHGHPPLWSAMAWLMCTFFCVGLLFGNLNALAMEPLGHIAGVGAAVVGSVSTLISIVFGVALGQAYDGTVLPLVAGFSVLGAGALGVAAWTERARE